MNRTQFDSDEVIVPVRLIDHALRCAGQSRAIVRVCSRGIGIAIEHYGDKTSADGQGEPIFIEFYDGKLRVIVNPDINVEEPMIINMEGAREENRLDECPSCGKPRPDGTGQGLFKSGSICPYCGHVEPKKNEED